MDNRFLRFVKDKSDQLGYISYFYNMLKKGRLLLFPSPIYDGGEIDIPQTVRDKMLPIKYIIAERVRTTRRLLKRIHPGIHIDEISFIEMDKHKGLLDETFMEWCKAGHDVGLFSEAGIPCVADPGYGYVDLAHRTGIDVVPFTGPNSILMALMASGFTGQQFEFHGYLPRDQGHLKDKLITIERSVQKTGKTHLFIETPYRNLQMIEAISHHLQGTTYIGIAADVSSSAQYIFRAQVKDLDKAKPHFKEKRPAIFVIGRP